MIVSVCPFPPQPPIAISAVADLGLLDLRTLRFARLSKKSRTPADCKGPQLAMLPLTLAAGGTPLASDPATRVPVAN